MLPSTTERVARNTLARINARIRRQTDVRVHECAEAGVEAIDKRLRELDREWDIERVLEMNAAGISLLGMGLGMFRSRRFLVLPAVVAGFLLQHAVQGWCPPVPVLRRLGIRTQSEIEFERYALKALRGDFERNGDDAGDPMLAARHALAAARR
jgi:hypothetical protein